MWLRNSLLKETSAICQIYCLQFIVFGCLGTDLNIGACLFAFKLLKSRIVALCVAGVYRVMLISFGVHFWYGRAHLLKRSGLTWNT